MSAMLRKIGGSVMVAIPPAVLDQLKLGPGEAVDVVAENGRIAITPKTPRRYSLDQLVAEHAALEGVDDNDGWTRSEARGREII